MYYPQAAQGSDGKPYASPDKPLYREMDQETGAEIFRQQYCHGWPRAGDMVVDCNRPGYILEQEPRTVSTYRLIPTQGRSADGDEVVDVDRNAPSWVDWISGETVEPWTQPVALGSKESYKTRYEHLFISPEEHKALPEREQMRLLPIAQRREISFRPSAEPSWGFLVGYSQKVQEHWRRVFEYYPKLQKCANEMVTSYPEEAFTPMTQLPSPIVGHRYLPGASLLPEISEDQPYSTPSDSSYYQQPGGSAAAQQYPGGVEHGGDTPMGGTEYAPTEYAFPPTPAATGKMLPPPQRGQVDSATENDNIIEAYKASLESTMRPNTVAKYKNMSDWYKRKLEESGESLFDFTSGYELAEKHAKNSTYGPTVANGVLRYRDNWNRDTQRPNVSIPKIEVDAPDQSEPSWALPAQASSYSAYSSYYGGQEPSMVVQPQAQIFQSQGGPYVQGQDYRGANPEASTSSFGNPPQEVYDSSSGSFPSAQVQQSHLSSASYPVDARVAQGYQAPREQFYSMPPDFTLSEDGKVIQRQGGNPFGVGELLNAKAGYVPAATDQSLYMTWDPRGSFGFFTGYGQPVMGANNQQITADEYALRKLMPLPPTQVQQSHLSSASHPVDASAAQAGYQAPPEQLYSMPPDFTLSEDGKEIRRQGGRPFGADVLLSAMGSGGSAIADPNLHLRWDQRAGSFVFFGGYDQPVRGRNQQEITVDEYHLRNLMPVPQAPPPQRLESALRHSSSDHGRRRNRDKVAQFFGIRRGSS